ncbi:MAG: MgtC/SapB family protein, partial [Spirochaetaceae bacterium]
MSGTLLALSQRIMHPEMQAMEFFLEAGLRLFMALVFGGMIGWERERHGQPAGLRTHMLICMGAALMMVLSAAISWQFPESQADPGRIAAQVV